MIQALDLDTGKRRTGAVILAICLNHRVLQVEYIQHCVHRPVLQLRQHAQHRTAGVERHVTVQWQFVNDALDEPIGHQPPYPVSQRPRYGLAVPGVLQLFTGGRGNAQHLLDIPKPRARVLDRQHALQQLGIAQALDIVERQPPHLGHGIEHHARPVHPGINGGKLVALAYRVERDFDSQALVALLNLGIRLAVVLINALMAGRQGAQQEGIDLRVETQVPIPQLGLAVRMGDLARLPQVIPERVHALAMSLAGHAGQTPADQHVYGIGQGTGKGAGLPFASLSHSLHDAIGQRTQYGALHDSIEPQYPPRHGSGEQAQHLAAYIGQCLLERLPILIGLAHGQQAQVGAVALHLPLGHCLRQRPGTASGHFNRQVQTVQIGLREGAAKTVIQNPRQPRHASGPGLFAQ